MVVPLILITNDDGVLSPGIVAAASAVRHLGELLIVAPRHQQSSMGRSFPWASDTGVIERLSVDVAGLGVTAYGVHGTPAQAVSHAILELAARKPALCISGFNYGSNLGLSLTCSGTVGAAFEADSHDVPTIAVSVEAPLAMMRSSDYRQINWEAAREVTARLAERVLVEGFPAGVHILNVNLPAGASPETPCRITKLSRANTSTFVKPAKRDHGRSFLLESEEGVAPSQLEAGSDVHAVRVERVVSITPLSWDFSVSWRCHRLFSDGLASGS